MGHYRSSDPATMASSSWAMTLLFFSFFFCYELPILYTSFKSKNLTNEHILVLVDALAIKSLHTTLSLSLKDRGYEVMRKSCNLLGNVTPF